jgi:hypothetical protein
MAMPWLHYIMNLLGSPQCVHRSRVALGNPKMVALLKRQPCALEVNLGCWIVGVFCRHFGSLRSLLLHYLLYYGRTSTQPTVQFAGTRYCSPFPSHSSKYPFFLNSYALHHHAHLSRTPNLITAAKTVSRSYRIAGVM